MDSLDGYLWKENVTCLNPSSFSALESTTLAILSNLALEFSSEHKISISFWSAYQRAMWVYCLKQIRKLQLRVIHTTEVSLIWKNECSSCFPSSPFLSLLSIRQNALGFQFQSLNNIKCVTCLLSRIKRVKSRDLFSSVRVEETWHERVSTECPFLSYMTPSPVVSLIKLNKGLLLIGSLLY